MRYQFVLVLVVCWLWTATSSQTEDANSPQTSHIQCSGMRNNPVADTVMFYCMVENYNISATCNDTEGIFNCSASIANFSNDYHTTDSEKTKSCECGCESFDEGQTSKSTMSSDCDCTINNKACNFSEPEVTSDGMTIIKYGVTPDNSSSISTIVVVLGVLVGLLLVLLAIVTTGLLWVCWLLKRKGGLKFKFGSDQLIRSSTDHGQLVNPTYEGDDLLRLQPGPAPAYETIPPHPQRDGGQFEIIEEGENGYHVLKREETVHPETTTNLEIILEDSREESYSKLELIGESGSAKKVNQEHITDYSTLETVNIGSSVSKGIDGATGDYNSDGSGKGESKKSVMVMDDNNAIEDDVHQLENGDVEKEQEEGKQPVVSITLDEGNERNETETSTVEIV